MAPKFPKVNNPADGLGGLVLSGCSNWDLGTNLKWRGICSSVWYIAHSYCLAVQAGFYSDVVECWLHMRRVAGSILSRGKWPARMLPFIDLNSSGPFMAGTSGKVGSMSDL